MKILFLSDTHEQHDKLTNLPTADMIIHGGDISNRGKKQEVDEFIDWFDGLDYKYKVFIAGNHDFYFENYTWYEIQKRLPEGMYYLCNSAIEIEGIKIWGSPITPWFLNWAFNRERGEDIMKYWKQIPEQLDILVTHGPPAGIRDRCKNGSIVGCEDLLSVIQRIKPKYHLFGHIHEGYGITESKYTTFINGSILNENYQLVNEPVRFEIEK
ncbi:metallophosphatase domain-containing protein [Dysgonomonas sp. 25]|uniref:metallophosphatase domain-containing protein n=1 Tax=Dysgonomonas sp. 25 TaxID=2302933 RepID=UPI0013D5FD51|nr:metallophosphatase domain-containing protein [Dysgonomonas sp. 25]NDV68928.1 metallophosphoesterase [Dysgonomonas sp. 25]